MLCIYKGTNLTIEKAKARSKDKNGNRGKYVATLHYKPMSETIRRFVKATDIKKLIAENETRFIVQQQNNAYTIYHNGENKAKYAVCNHNDYQNFIRRFNLTQLYSSSDNNIITYFLK